MSKMVSKNESDNRFKSERQIVADSFLYSNNNFSSSSPYKKSKIFEKQHLGSTFIPKKLVKVCTSRQSQKIMKNMEKRLEIKIGDIGKGLHKIKKKEQKHFETMNGKMDQILALLSKGVTANET
jgi:hypothetical protein